MLDRLVGCADRRHHEHHRRCSAPSIASRSRSRSIQPTHHTAMMMLMMLLLSTHTTYKYQGAYRPDVSWRCTTRSIAQACEPTLPRRKVARHSTYARTAPRGLGSRTTWLDYRLRWRSTRSKVRVDWRGYRAPLPDRRVRMCAPPPEADYVGLCLPSGIGSVADLAKDKELGRLVAAFHENSSMKLA